MKRLTGILALVLALVLIAAVPAAAADLKIEGTKPKDGATGKQPANMAIKVQFAEDMSNPDNDTVNKDKIRITDPEGNAFEVTVAHHDKYPNELWFVLNDTLAQNTEYTVELLPGIVSTAGNTTSEVYKTTFKTRNTSTDSTISTVLMIAMFALMFLLTKRETQKQQASQDVNYALAEAKKLNPYKVAKQKKISLEEAQQYCEKERAKAQKAVDKYNAEKAKKDAEMQAEIEAAQARIEAEMLAAHKASVFSVKTRASVKAAGGTIPKSVRNRAKEKEEAEKLAAKQREQNAKGRKSKK